MIDRAARTKLAEIIRAYLDERISAFEFHDALQEIDDHRDSTVRELVIRLWYFYDDIKDHKVVATKEEWNELQRILLLLDSDSMLVVKKAWKWTARQFVAAIAAVVFVALAFRFGWGLHLILLGFPFSAVSLPLFIWRRRAYQHRGPKELAIFPFSSVEQLWSIRRQAKCFAKRRYPPELADRTIRSKAEDQEMWFTAVMGMLMFAPVCLLFQAMPEFTTKTSVKTP